MSVTATKDTAAQVVRSIEAMAGKHVVIGIPAAKAPRKGDPISNAALGYVHEHGSPAQNIPPRPFLVPGVKAAAPDVMRVLRNAAVKSIGATARREELVRGLHAAGLLAQASIKQTLKDLPEHPDDSAVIRARRRAGFKGSKALIRTGQLLNSVTYEVRDR